MVGWRRELGNVGLLGCPRSLYWQPMKKEPAQFSQGFRGNWKTADRSSPCFRDWFQCRFMAS